jgi:glycosyltransferase involved in cell wall biosynthesis
MMSKGLVLNVPRRFVMNEWGGTETVIYETAKQLIQIGYPTQIITTQALSDKQDDSISNVPIKRFSYSYTRFGLSNKNHRLLDKRGGNMYSIGLALYALLCKNTKVIHLHTLGRVGALMRLVAKLKKVPYVISIHGGLLDLPLQQLNDLVAPTKRSFNWGKVIDLFIPSSRLIEDAEAVICVGKQEQEKLQERYPEKAIHFLPNGVDVTYFNSGSKVNFLETARQHGYDFSISDKFVLCVSSFYPQKNQLCLIEAFATQRLTKPTLKLVLIGVIYDHAYFEQINQKIEELGLKNDVLFLTNIRFDSPVLIDAYKAADLFMLPSKYETFGIVILEAWASGTPVICGGVGGIPSFVKDNINGLFCDTTSPPSIDKAMSFVLDNETTYADLSTQGLLSVQNYSWQTLTNKLVDIYEDSFIQKSRSL